MGTSTIREQTRPENEKKKITVIDHVIFDDDCIKWFPVTPRAVTPMPSTTSLFSLSVSSSLSVCLVVCLSACLSSPLSLSSPPSLALSLALSEKSRDHVIVSSGW